MEEERIARLETELKEVREIVEENNEIIRDLRRIGRIAFWGKVIIWVLVLVVPFILFSTVLAPYLSGSSNLFGLPSPEQIQQVLDAYEGNYE